MRYERQRTVRHVGCECSLKWEATLQSDRERKAEDNTRHKTVSNLSTVTRNPQGVSLALLLTSKREKSSEPSSRRTTPPSVDNLRDEVNSITRRWSEPFSRPIRCFAGRTGGADCRRRANKLVVAVLTRMHLAKTSYACLLYNVGASE